jgi:hypothetical protein
MGISLARPLVLEVRFMLLEAYFDDSGKESESGHRFVCIAGYLSPTSVWDAFNQNWEGLLLRHGIPELHMKRWKSIRSEKGWTDAQADAALNDFVDLIRQGHLWGFGAGVDAHQWKTLPREKTNKLGSAQEFVMQRVFRMIMDEVGKSGLVAHINLVFDQDEEFSKPRLTRYYDIRRIDPLAKERAVIISFAAASQCPALQAADLLAYLTRARLEERANGQPESAHWRRLMTEFPGYGIRYSWDGWTGPDVEAELDRALATLTAASPSGVPA